MRLVYFASEPNVGDALNPWMWPRLLGDALDDDPDHAFLGIGTILVDGYVRNARKVTVCGSGARSRRMLPDLSSSEWDLRFVRGPKTAGITGAPFISDPAILMPTLLPGQDQRKGRAFVPHFKTRPETIAQVAQDLEADVLSPSLGVEDFIQKLTSYKEVVCEAMHGAILADAYRIPWAGLRLDVGHRSGQGNVFKWKDWCQSIEAPYQFEPLPLICYAPFFIRNRFQPKEWRLPTKFEFGLSPDAALNRAQDKMMDALEHLSRPVHQ